LPPLTSEKAVQLLQAWGHDCASDNVASGKICNLLGGLPLAVFLAGRYMAQSRQLAKDYLTWLKTTPLAALDFGGRQHKSIPILMDRSMAQVGELARAAFSVAGVLAYNPFESEIIAIPLGITSLEVNRCLGELVDYGLLLRPDNRYQVTHALGHTYARKRLPLKRDALLRLAEHLRAKIPDSRMRGQLDYSRFDACRAHILAVQSACLAANEWNIVCDITWAIDFYLDRGGHWTERVEALDAGLLAASAECNSKTKISFLLFKSRTYGNLGDFDRAMEPCNEALMEARKSDNHLGEGKALRQLGFNYSMKGNYRSALEFLELSLSVFSEIKNYRNKGKVLGNLGHIHLTLGDPSRAAEFFELRLNNASKSNSLEERGAALVDLGRIHSSLGDYNKAIVFYQQSLEINHNIGNRKGEGATLRWLGESYSNLGDDNKAIEFHQQSLEITREIGDRQGEGVTLGRLGESYFHLGDYNKAIEFYQQSLEIMREIGDRQSEGVTLGWLGESSSHLGDDNKAIEFYQQSLEINRGIGNRKGEGATLGRLGESYSHLGDDNKALEFHQQSLEINRGIGNRKGEGTTI
jgi:tetratricopeptide (TPR) repeat protein